MMITPHIFTPSELQLPYDEWERLVSQVVSTLAIQEIRWLDSWQAWDLACSSMDDDKRRYIRYGWYMGYIAKQDWAWENGYEAGLCNRVLE